MNNNANAPRQYIPIEIERITCTIYAVCASLAIIKNKKKFLLLLFKFVLSFCELPPPLPGVCGHFPSTKKKKENPPL
jgi:hypothetical protein